MNRRLFSFNVLKSVGAGLVACLAPGLKLSNASVTDRVPCLKLKTNEILHLPKGWKANRHRDLGYIPHVDWVDDSWNHVRDGLPPVSDKNYECLTTVDGQHQITVHRARRIPYQPSDNPNGCECWWANGFVEDGQENWYCLYIVEYWRESI